MNYFTNYDLENIVTPLKVENFAKLLRDSNYDRDESQFLIEGFTNGFDIGYSGPKVRQSRANNIPLMVGTKEDLWNKIMKEVGAGRYAGPFEEISFDNYIQSPVGLVPKKGQAKTRLIFHLSYDFKEDNINLGSTRLGDSVNGCTPKELCSVSYNDLDKAIQLCILMSEKAVIENGTITIVLRKTDLSNAFCVLPFKKTVFLLASP